MDYHQREVNIHNVYDQKLIGHVRYRQHPNENSSGGAKLTDGSQHEGYTKLVRIIGSTRETERIYDSLIWKEVGESCLFGLKVLNRCHEIMINLVCNDFGII
jgi:hypothetical protein